MSERGGAGAPHPVIGVLRAGVLFGLGWVAAAGLAWAAFGIGWAALLLMAWGLLLRHFHRAVERLGRSLAQASPPLA